MKMLSITALMCFAASISNAEVGWSLYSEEPRSDLVSDRISAEDVGVLSELLESYVQAAPEFPQTREEVLAACAERLRDVARISAFNLVNYSYEMNLTIEGVEGALKGVSCRMITSNDENLQIEVKED
ncbi:hypothetical protein [Ruegeria sp.]|uniref:hypothetical protein n=1 Tax=Ruegeria sp. TaxID=1879320 RepID=UPI003C7B6BC2